MKTDNLLYAILLGLSMASLSPVSADEIGSVDTKFILVGPDHKIVVDAFDDPKIRGVACYLSRAKTGGIKGALGVAEDTSDASISCRQVGPIEMKEDLEEGERVFTERRSLIFKKLQVVRFCDTSRNTIVYLAYSDRIIEGSPQNSVSSVPIMPWGIPKNSPSLAMCRYTG
ncbi:MAG: CreA family protein [Gammaproteobacteria bacterium]|nr:CreA family protein [Gammaproteobacteria bacterium]